jgi:hypothetical protein
VGVDTTLLKALQQAKNDALDAKVSEQAARRKLADAEADLKQAKDEAGRATKQAEQAKADAQSARDRRQRPRTNSLMWKRLERQPKREKKPAKTPPKDNQVSAPACDRGSGINRLIPKSVWSRRRSLTARWTINPAESGIVRRSTA